MTAIQPVPEAPDEGVLYSININLYWANVLSGLLATLQTPAAWATDDQSVITQQINYTEQLQNILYEAQPVDCDDVGNCIDTNEAIQQIIQQQIIENMNNNTIYQPIANQTGYPMPQSVLIQNINYGGPQDPGSCTYDKTYGAAVNFIEELEGMISEAYNALVGIATVGRAINYFLSWTGLTAQPILNGMAQTAEFMYDVGFTNWLNVKDALNAEDAACRIWCTWKDDCVLTLDRAFTAVTERFDELAGRNVESVEDFIAFILEFAFDLSWGGQVLYYGNLALYIGYLKFIQEAPNPLVHDGTPRRLREAIRNGFFVEDPEWIDCDSCPSGDPCATFDRVWEEYPTSGIEPMEVSPPLNFPTSFQSGFYVTRWADLRADPNQSLRWTGYPADAGDNDAVTTATMYIFEDPCDLIQATVDSRFATSNTSKSQQIWVLQGASTPIEWGNFNNIAADEDTTTSNSLGALNWTGLIYQAKAILFIATGRSSGGAAPRFRETSWNK